MDYAALAPLILVLGAMLVFAGVGVYIANQSTRISVFGIAHDGGTAGHQRCKQNRDGTVTYKRSGGNVRLVLKKSMAYPTKRGLAYIADVSSGKGLQAYIAADQKVYRVSGQENENYAVAMHVAQLNEATKTDLSRLASTIMIGLVVLGVLVVGGVVFIVSKLGDAGAA